MHTLLHACRKSPPPRSLSDMPTAILAILHVVGEQHAEAVCAAALSHVAAAATAQLPIKLVILHNRPSHFEKPLRALIGSHISNVVFCSYTGLLSGGAKTALFGHQFSENFTPGGKAQNYAHSPLQTADGARETPSTPGTLAMSSHSRRLSPALSRSKRFNEGMSGYIGGPGVDSAGWGISSRQLSDYEALQCILGQVAVGCDTLSLLLFEQAIRTVFQAFACTPNSAAEKWHSIAWRLQDIVSSGGDLMCCNPATIFRPVSYLNATGRVLCASVAMPAPDSTVGVSFQVTFECKIQPLNQC